MDREYRITLLEEQDTRVRGDGTGRGTVCGIWRGDKGSGTNPG